MRTLTLKGEVGPDGKLHFDVPCDIPPGPVEVILRPLKPPREPAEDLMQFLLGAPRARMEAAGCHFMDDEVREYVEQMRADDIDRDEEIVRKAERETDAPFREGLILVYLDSVIVIYIFDHTGSFQSRAIARLAASLAAMDRFAVSDLTRLECRVQPIRLGDSVRLDEFDRFFARPDVTMVPLPTAVFDRATDICARHGFKPLDSIHLAAAVEAGCGAFLTNDARLSHFPDLTVEVFP